MPENGVFRLQEAEASPYVVLNADDFGMSFGVNRAIENLVIQGALNSASLMTSGYAFEDALVRAKDLQTKYPFFVGLHFNLTYRHARSCRGYSFLTDTSGCFRHSFMSLMVCCLRSYVWGTSLERFKLLRVLYRELKAQYQAIKDSGLTVGHVDGHQHVHLIPMVYQVVERFALKQGIKRIRHINERFGHTLRHVPRMVVWTHHGWLKWVLLQLLQRCYSVHPMFQHSPYFFSLLQSCHIQLEKLSSSTFPPKGYRGLEVMLHPSVVSIDQEEAHYRVLQEDAEAPHLFHPARTLEYETLLKHGQRLIRQEDALIE
jgi:predicted glycoside hydrolase/deacetylase ChbG (UPF0249 family)